MELTRLLSRDEPKRASLRAVSTTDPATRRVRLRGRVDPGDATRLADSLRAVLEATKADLVICDVGALAAPDAAAVDAICRMRLSARRAGSVLRLDHASSALRELLDLTGLSEVAGSDDASGVEP
jgi:ABC-type transporter Mla MlaB component